MSSSTWFATYAVRSVNTMAGPRGVTVAVRASVRSPVSSTSSASTRLPGAGSTRCAACPA